MKFEKNVTERGFTNIRFTDRYDVECVIGESSLASEDAIWVGVVDPDPRIMIENVGWEKINLPDNISITTQMHLTRNQVKELLPILEKFVTTGRLD